MRRLLLDRTCLLSLLSIAVWATPISEVEARPPGPEVFCDLYPDAPACATSTPECAFCHTAPPALNPFGQSLSGALLPDESRPLSDAAYADGLPFALADVEPLDSDGDGFTNLEEFIAGSFPGDPNSVPAGDECATLPDDWAPEYQVCEYDYDFALKKVQLDFCGQSPSREALDAFRASEDPEAELHAALDACLQTNFWRGRDGIVWNLANSKVRPVASVKAGEDAGGIPLADYLDDYSLFVYTQIDNHDAREVLTGQYFVRRSDGPRTEYQRYEASYLQELATRGGGVAQLTDTDVRAGMLTTRWNLFMMTMFTAVPRTTAAAAYRSYLGYDISKMEGLYPIDDEPVDYDDKDVQEPVCAGCHSTLDPLTYPFSRYEGIGGGDRGLLDGYIPGSYNPGRLQFFTSTDSESVVDTPEQGYIFGQPVDDLVEWAAVAANSDAFARATVSDYWELLMGEPPAPKETAEFDGLWRDFMTEHQYGVDNMLHAIIMTEAYGVP